MPMTRLQSAYLLSLRRARAQAKRERDDLIDRFESVNEEIRDELRGCFALLVLRLKWKPI
jgi:hypothetical protein